MAEVRKAKTENHAKSRSRAGASLVKTGSESSSPRRSGATAGRRRSSALSGASTQTSRIPLVSKGEAEIKRLLVETQDQLSLIHGVLEELCERQEAMAAWQMEFSKRLVTLQEAQWRSLEDLAGVDMGRPVEKAFGIQLDQVDPEAMEDQFDEASKVVDEINSHAMPKRAERIRKRRDPLRPVSHEASASASDAELESTNQDKSPESVFVMPAKVDVH